MFFNKKICEKYRGRDAIIIRGLKNYSLRDTLECGQAFRYEQTVKEDGYVEYLTVAYGKIIRVGQRKVGELIFYDTDDETFEKIIRPYFDLDADYEKIKVFSPVP